MKNRIITLLIACMGCLSLTGQITADDNLQTVKAKFDKPFNRMTLPTAWKVDDKDKNEIEFVHVDNDNVTFGLVAGRSMKKDATLDVLQRQIEDFLNKKSRKIEILEKSFHLKMSSKDSAQARSDMEGTSFDRVMIGKTEWLKFHCKGEITVTTVVDKTKTKTKTPTRQVNYASFINKRLHLVTFEAPVDLFDGHVALFESTMAELCK